MILISLFLVFAQIVYIFDSTFMNYLLQIDEICILFPRDKFK